MSSNFISFSPWHSVENEEWTSNYDPCGIERDCMNMSIYERQTITPKQQNYNYISKPLLSNDKRINQTQINRLKTAPYKNGKNLINRKKELKIQTGIATMEKKSLNVLSEVSIDSSTPLIPEMVQNFNGQNNIYNFSQIGINTRNLDQNKSNNLYIKKCIANINKINQVINHQ
jgi:hypothetical protein